MTLLASFGICSIEGQTGCPTEKVMRRQAPAQQLPWTAVLARSHHLPRPQLDLRAVELTVYVPISLRPAGTDDEISTYITI